LIYPTFNVYESYYEIHFVSKDFENKTVPDGVISFPGVTEEI
jgi:hypothetical protein